jgi:hypothetical protein
MSEDTTTGCASRDGKIIITISGCGEPPRALSYDLSTMTEQQAADVVAPGGAFSRRLADSISVELRRRLGANLSP